MAMSQSDISSFLDHRGRVTALPKKAEPRHATFSYLADKFEYDKTYSQKEVNDILKEWHTFDDWALLRREMFDRGFFERRPNGSEYTRKK